MTIQELLAETLSSDAVCTYREEEKVGTTSNNDLGIIFPRDAYSI